MSGKFNKRSSGFFKSRRKVNFKPEEAIKVGDINYKNIELLSNFITQRGTITPRRRSSRLSKIEHVKIAKAIKRARMMALLPFDRVSRN